jgi:EF hand
MRNLVLIPILLTAAVSSNVWAAAHERDAFIKQYDTNRDQKVGRAEFDAARAQRFKASDANNDGVLDEGEYLSEYVVHLDAELAQSKLSEAEKTEMRQRQLRQTLVRFKILDTDKDGRMTRAEYDVSGARSFVNHDTDKDGEVSAKDEPVERSSAR